MIVLRIAYQGNPLAVLGSRADKGDAPNIDILDSFGAGYTRLGNRSLERIKVNRYQIDIAPSHIGKCLIIFFSVTRQQTAMNSRM